MPVLLEGTHVLQSSLFCTDIFALLEEVHSDAVTRNHISAVKDPRKQWVCKKWKWIYATDRGHAALCLCYTNKRQWMVQDHSSQPV